MKWYVYLICGLLIVAGSFCGIELYKQVKAESYVNGSIDIENTFSVENFSYASTSVIFYRDIYDENDTHSYSNDLVKVEDFDGVKNEYELLLNGYILLDTKVSAGSIFSVFYLDFYNTDGDLICSADMKISILFLSNKTTLTLSVTDAENASFMTQYFADNGIRLKINKLL